MVYITLSFDYMRTIAGNRVYLHSVKGTCKKGITIKTTLRNYLVLNLLRRVFDTVACYLSIGISEQVFHTNRTVINAVIDDSEKEIRYNSDKFCYNL